MSLAKTPLVWLAGAVLLTGTVSAGVLQLSGSASAGGTGSASTSKADFGLAAQPGSTTVQQGRTGSYAVTVSGVNGFTGTVALTASGLPAGVTGTLTPSSVSLGSASQASSTFVVAVAKTTALGSYTLTLTGTSGSGKSAVTHTTTVGLTVQKQNGSLSLTATPSPLTLEPGSRGTYNLALSRSGAAVDAPATLSLSGALPAGATATFASPNPTTGSSSSLGIATSSSTPTGRYPLSITATAGDYTATTAVSLVVATSSGKAFGIADPAVAVTSLAPGAVPRPLDLRISNPNSQQIAITNLTVSVDQPLAAACTQGNFAVTQVPSGYPVLVPAGAVDVPLSSLGLSVAQLPTLQLRNLSTNQDACKSTTVTLAYTGSATSN